MGIEMLALSKQLTQGRIWPPSARSRAGFPWGGAFGGGGGGGITVDMLL